ncbi:MAG: hypothetical protein HY700_20380 [Gemmatimonadetes bacterium]|nr:hypothetical protein [Gemmatimonadota bacterium]
MQRFSRVLTLIAATLLAACGRDAAAPSAAAPSLAISDGAHDAGNGHFYFLPPVVSAPAFTGTFDAQRSPTVVICALEAGGCGSVIAEFSMTSGPGSETVRVAPKDERYLVNWHTDQFTLNSSVIYRILVSVEGTPLGFADVDVVDSGRELRSVSTGEFVALVDGRTLPIAFRIEEGAIPATPVFAAVDAGFSQSCAVSTAHLGFCWGDTPYGSFYTPTPVPGGVWFAMIAAGSTPGGPSLARACGLTPAGAAYCWGWGSDGFLGDGTDGSSTAPVPVADGYTFTTLTVGMNHVCALDADGAAYCWGNGAWGALGNAPDLGARGNNIAPGPVLGGLRFQSISAGEDFTCAVTTTGAAYCWGINDRGQLGSISTEACNPGEPVPIPCTLTPAAVQGGLSFRSAWAGQYHACALTSLGEAYCWGRNYYGELGDGTTAPSLAPTAVSGGLNLTSLSTGSMFTCGIAAGGQLYCWGYGGDGRLGDGANTSSAVPVPVAGSDTHVAVGTGLNHACGLTTIGTVLCWGQGSLGQLGTGSGNASAVPVPISIP